MLVLQSLFFDILKVQIFRWFEVFDLNGCLGLELENIFIFQFKIVFRSLDLRKKGGG